LGLFSARDAVERECLPGEIAVTSVEFFGTEARAIEKDLQTSGSFDINLAGFFLSSGLFPRRCRQDAA